MPWVGVAGRVGETRSRGHGTTMNIFAPLIRRPAGASLLGIGLLMAGIWAYMLLGGAAARDRVRCRIGSTQAARHRDARRIDRLADAYLAQHAGDLPVEARPRAAQGVEAIGCDGFGCRGCVLNGQDDHDFRRMEASTTRLSRGRRCMRRPRTTMVPRCVTRARHVAEGVATTRTHHCNVTGTSRRGSATLPDQSPAKIRTT